MTAPPAAGTSGAETWDGSGSERATALLALADGEVFEGEAIGAAAPGGMASGELVFNTVLSGYQEVITDPSYAGQVVAFTYPHIGNHGVNPADDEARQPWCRGVVVRDLVARPSSWRTTGSLEDSKERTASRAASRKHPRSVNLAAPMRGSVALSSGRRWECDVCLRCA